PAVATRAASRVVWPVPQPMSRTRDPGLMSAAEMKLATYEDIDLSNLRCSAVQMAPSCPSHASSWAAFDGSALIVSVSTMTSSVSVYSLGEDTDVLLPEGGSCQGGRHSPRRRTRS